MERTAVWFQNRGIRKDFTFDEQAEKRSPHIKSTIMEKALKI